jgi:hypothetical protein
MQSVNQKLYSVQIKKNLDNIIEKGSDINKKNIIEAEMINYKRAPTEVLSYDSFGFLDKYKDKNEINRYLKYKKYLF